MRTPATSSAQTFYLDPTRRNVIFNQFAYPTLQALSVFNKANDTAVIQGTSNLQPVWSGSLLAGTYVGRNNPEATGISGLLFSGSQYMKYDSLATTYATPELALTVVCMVSCASTGGTVWGFGDPSDTYTLSLSYAGGTLSLSEVNSHGTFTASATVTHDTVHVVTAIRVGNTLTLRVDQLAGSAVAVTAGTAVPTTFTVGALNSNGSVSSQFNGSIGKLAVYSGSADVFGVEVAWLQDLGVIRGPTSGTNTGF